MYLIITLIPLYSIYLSYKYNKKLGYFIFVLLILGFGSVIISGFTPSLTSDGRIYLNYLFEMCIRDRLWPALNFIKQIRRQCFLELEMLLN